MNLVNTNQPISQEETLKKFVNAGWKLIKREKNLIFVQGKEGQYRVIDKHGYMKHLSIIPDRWEEPEIKAMLEKNLEIAKKRCSQ